MSLVLLSCKSSSTQPSTGHSFALYFLSDTTLTARDALAQPIDHLVLAGTPFLTAADMQTYTWPTHSFTLTDAMSSTWQNFQRLYGKSAGVPFVATVNGTKIYEGTFWWAYSSMMPPDCAVIQVIWPAPYVISKPANAEDMRSDPRIYQALKDAGVLVE